MSFLKKLFKGVVVGAIVGLTGGLALPALGIATIGGAAITLKGAVIFGAIYGGLQGAAAGFIKKPKLPTGDVQARSNITVDPQALGKWIFGETAAGTDVVYAEKVGDSAIVHVIAAAAHEIDSFGSLYINGELVTLSGTSATGGWAGALSVYRNLGTETQSALSIPSSGWPSSARGLGIAHYAFKWDYSTNAGKEKLSGGIPTRITQVVRGSKVYDPRLDSTRGGSGSHRADDQSTWEWSSNWALIVAHYLLGWYSNNKLIYGVGADPDDIDWASVITMANVCDTVLDGKPKYRIGGIFSITQDHENIIGQLEAAIGGKVSRFGGKYYIWCPHDDLISAGTLTDADIVAEGGIRFTPSGPIENLFNTARGQYVEPSILYQLQPYPEVIESTAVTEDGKERLLQQDFPMVQDAEIAQRVARELVRRSRFSGTITVVVGPKGLLVKPFDVITANFRETNFANELFRVVSMQYSAGGAIVMELLEEDASIYDTSAPLGSSLVQLDPNAYDPAQPIPLTGLDAENTSIILTGGRAASAIRVFWDLPSGFVGYTEVNYRTTISGDFTYTQNTERNACLVMPVLDDTLYEIRARHVTISGVPGSWVTIFVTTGNAEFDRVSFIGIADPIDPTIWVDTNPNNPLARIRVQAGFSPQPSDPIPDRMFIFYSVSEIPNRFKVTTDGGSRIYLSTTIGEGVSGLFNLTVAAGSTDRVVRYEPSSFDPDLSGAWWASVRDDPNPPSLYYKVSTATDSELLFAPDVQFPFTPSAGQLIDVAEVDFSDPRTGEFRLGYANGEVIRHNGIGFDGARYYIDVAERGAEGTTQGGIDGQFFDYYPAYGALTEVIEVSVSEFVETGGVYIADTRSILNLPNSFSWASVTCCLAKSVSVSGREVFVRSNIVPLVIAGPAA